jgi:glucosamine-6-phosphate deaminase
MKLDLSSQISLERIPQRYYRPENALEESALTRYEKINTRIFESIEKGSAKVAREIVKAMLEKQKKGQPFVLGLPGGVSPQSVYTQLIQLHKEENVSFSNLVVFNTYEYFPLTDETNSNLHSLKETFLNEIDIKTENIYSPDVMVDKDDILDSCERFGEQLKSIGGLDYLLLGLGSKGNIGFNMPGSNVYSQTRLVVLDGDSINDAATIFGTKDKVPVSAITMGLSDMQKR